MVDTEFAHLGSRDEGGVGLGAGVRVGGSTGPPLTALDGCLLNRVAVGTNDIFVGAHFFFFPMNELV